MSHQVETTAAKLNSAKSTISARLKALPAAQPANPGLINVRPSSATVSQGQKTPSPSQGQNDSPPGSKSKGGVYLSEDQQPLPPPGFQENRNGSSLLSSHASKFGSNSDAQLNQRQQRAASVAAENPTSCNVCAIL